MFFKLPVDHSHAKLYPSQLTKMYRESSSEKDNMVMKYAQAEQRNIELVDRMTKMDAARREFLKEKELAVGRFRSVITEKQRLHDMFEAKVCCHSNGYLRCFYGFLAPIPTLHLKQLLASDSNSLMGTLSHQSKKS